jgi:hypothetical protein
MGIIKFIKKKKEEKKEIKAQFEKEFNDGRGAKNE